MQGWAPDHSGRVETEKIAKTFPREEAVMLAKEHWTIICFMRDN